MRVESGERAAAVLYCITMAMAVSAQLVNLSSKAELKLVEAVAGVMPSGQVSHKRDKTPLIGTIY